MENFLEEFKGLPIEEKYIIIAKAFKNVCLLLRQHPIDLDWFLESPAERLPILTGGSVRDPIGEEYAQYFVKEQMKNRS